MRRIPLLLVLPLLTRFANAQQPASSASGYVLQGTVRDSLTHRPVPGVHVWPLYRSWGAVSDAAGRYQLRWPLPAVWIFLVRKCDDQNLTRVSVTFRDTLVIERDILVSTSAAPCSLAIRAPWATDERDTTSFRGHYIYSWEGGGWLTSCDGHRYHPDWDSPLASALRDHRGREGQRTFVELRGRVAEDGLDIDFPGPLFLVAKVVTTREPSPTDCR